jgi:putative phosphoesterase
MRFGIVSDIHCNIEGLKTALDHMGEIDALFCAGDMIFQYRWSNDVIGLLRDLDAHVVLGNHDEIFLSPAMQHAHARPNVDPVLLDWLRQQPAYLDVQVDGKRIHMTHGTPWEPRYEYKFPQDPIWRRAADLEADALFVGHTHFQMAKRFGSTLVINPGSTGDPRDTNNRYQLSCAVWDTDSDEVLFHEFADPTRNFLQTSGQMR